MVDLGMAHGLGERERREWLARAGEALIEDDGVALSSCWVSRRCRASESRWAVYVGVGQDTGKTGNGMILCW